MKTKVYLSVMKNILGRRTYSCHSQIISKSDAFFGKIDQFRLISYRQCSSLVIDTVKLLDRPEVQTYLNLVSDEYDKLENSENQSTSVLMICNEIKKCKNNLKNLKTLNTENDKDMQKLIDSEENNFIREMKRLKSELIMYALPKDYECNSVIFSVVPGLGGQEAKLFAEELFHMYLQYARFKNWVVSSSSKSTSDGGGVSKAEAIISGESVFRLLKYEAGIHRVQRIPATEKFGKLQTSTCKINVIPYVEANEIVLNSKDLKFETKTSSGPGGQNVNKVETCVRVTYIPTGLTVECQSERLQSANKTLALKKLRNILFQEQQKGICLKVKDMKMEQAATLKRSDKIRTYNFIQNRVTDHRINFTINHIEKYMEGNKSLDNMLSQMDANYQEEYLLRNINRMLKQKNVSELFKRQGKI